MGFLGLFDGYKKKKDHDVVQIIKEDVGGEIKLREFRDIRDFLMSMLMTGLMATFDNLDQDGAIRMARSLCRELGQPQTNHKWNLISIKISRYGLKAMMHRIRREFLWALK